MGAIAPPYDDPAQTKQAASAQILPYVFYKLQVPVGVAVEEKISLSLFIFFGPHPSRALHNCENYE